MKKKCLNCDVEFTTSKKDRKFCSNKCYHEHLKKYGVKKLKKEIPNEENENLVEVTCCVCGKKEYVYKSRAKKYKTCSRECSAIYLQKLNSQKLTLICPICGCEYESKRSAVSHHKTCGKPECRKEWASQTRTGANNPNYRRIENLLKTQGLHNNEKRYYQSQGIYRHIVKEILGLKSCAAIPKGYVIHHKDCNHYNHNPHNLIVIPKKTHILIHKWFGNILLSALHTGKITRELFFDLCNDEQKTFYLNIIDLDVTGQAVVKQGELLENPEMDNQQPSVYRNIYEGSTTNGRVLPSDVEDSNSDTSALPTKSSEDIV